MPVETPAQYARQHPRPAAVAGSSTATASPTGPSNGSRTMTIEHDDDDDDAKADAHEATGRDRHRVGVLRLRGRALPGGPRVQWQDDVVDNEMLNRKKSKICCIYHKPKEFDESSSDESGSESASSDGSNDSRVARPPRQRHSRRHHHHDHDHDHDHNGCGPSRANPSASASSSTLAALTAAPLTTQSIQDRGPEVPPAEPNAYERLPNRSDKGKGRA